jgi:hypothetical protein
MIRSIYNLKLFDSYKEKECYICKARKTKTNGVIVDPHHLKKTGVDRLDVPENLVALCRVCHDSVHSGSKGFTDRLLEIGVFEFLRVGALFNMLTGVGLNKNAMFEQYEEKARNEVEGYCFKKDEYRKARPSKKIQSRPMQKYVKRESNLKKKMDGSVVCRYCDKMPCECKNE